MVQDGRVLPCARKGCKSESRGKGRFCSDSCRAKASHARNFVRVKESKPSRWNGPVCWCGRPGRFEEAGGSRCGNHASQRRAEKDRWRKLFRELQSRFTLEQLREMANGYSTAAV